MPLPIVAASAIGVFVAGLVAAIVNNIGRLLVAAGMMFVSIKGMERVANYMIQDIQAISSFFNGGMGDPYGIARAMMQLSVYAGLFDALNILISGYISVLALNAVRVFAARASK